MKGNTMSNYSFIFTTWKDNDNDGSPDFNDPDDDNDNVLDDQDAFPLDSLEDTDTDGDNIGNNADLDDDGDGVPDTDDDFPLDSTEDTDYDDDGIGDNADPDDDNDGYLDEWEPFLGTDPLDQNDMPIDTDNDGIPDGDSTNSLPWMDTDDDGDDIPDDEEISPQMKESILADYWWIILLISLIAVISLMVALRGKPKPVVEEITEEPALETELCPKCGFDIEKGTKCPFCTEETPPEPAQVAKPVSPKSTPNPPTKPTLSKEEMLARIEKAYKEGKMTEAQYLKNLEKFK
jgi:hypothetical protein